MHVCVYLIIMLPADRRIEHGNVWRDNYACLQLVKIIRIYVYLGIFFFFFYICILQVCVIVRLCVR